jgi:hypothetical protein
MISWRRSENNLIKSELIVLSDLGKVGAVNVTAALRTKWGLFKCWN